MCSDLATLRHAVGEVQPDVVVADIRMPPTKTDEGIRLGVELRTTHPEIGVVILSQYAEPLYATTLLEEGSDRRAYLLKDRVQHRGDLGRAVREVAEGRSVVDPRIVELLLSAKRKRDDLRFDLLITREQRDSGSGRGGLEQRCDLGAARDHQARRRTAHRLDLFEIGPWRRPST